MPRIPIEARRRTTAAKLAALTLANALIFQEVLSEADLRVEPIRRLLQKSDFQTALANHWGLICDQINYVPIFHIARAILVAIPSNASTVSALRKLAEQSLQIVSERAALRHDLMGRVYHYLLLEAKFLGTYYTSVSAATLLLKLALRIDHVPLDWTNLAALKQFRVADLACGTGTLLMAVSQVLTDNFVRASVRKGKTVDSASLKQLHQIIMEDVLHGYDVLPSAVHLTASTLALLAPEIAFKKMQLYSMPLGKTPEGEIYLGSIEYLGKDRVETQLDLMGTPLAGGAAGALSGKGTAGSVAPLPKLDLCVMNPPFVRSVGGNLLFGSLPQWRREMQDELSQRLHPTHGHQIMASSTAGLGAVFTAIGDQHIRPGGRIALVLPAAITTGVAWSRTRALINSKYDLEFIATNHDATKWSFSENTDLSEVLIVARKREQSGKSTEACTFINLWRNPSGSADALATADIVLRVQPPKVEKVGHGICALQIGNLKWGESVSVLHSDLQRLGWIGGSFAQTELIRTLFGLCDGEIRIPGSNKTQHVKLCPLGKIAILGPDRRDIADGFNPSISETPYPVLWGHDADLRTTIRGTPNKWLSPLTEAKKGRPLRDAGVLWARSGRIMIAERMWLATQRLTALRLDQPGLSNVWWPTALQSGQEKHEKALVLWLNSTLGLILTIGLRVPTRGPWVQFKKPTLKAMPVLNVLQLSEQQLNILVTTFDKIADKSLKPLSEMEDDHTRGMIDDAFSFALELPPLSPLRSLLAHEPVIRNEALRPAEAEVDQADQFELLFT